jgi:hypothetical protein
MGHSAGMSHSSGFASHAGGMTGMHVGSPGLYHSGSHTCYNCGYHYPHYSHPFYYPYVRYGYRYPYYGYGYGYGGYWPWWWDTSSSYNNDDSSYQNDAASRQIDGLSQQVQQLRDQLEASQYAQSRYEPSAPAVQVPRPPDSGSRAGKQSDKNADTLPASPELATVLVFRDQRIQEIKNYAIVGKTLVVIAEERQRKIPLADLDLDATTKLNEERGVEFQLPR